MTTDLKTPAGRTPDADAAPYVEGDIGYLPDGPHADGLFSPTALAAMSPDERAKAYASRRNLKTCRIYDGWVCKEPPSLERHGFCAVKHKTQFGDVRDLTQFQAGYPDEMLDLILRLSGASWVLPKRVDIVMRASAQKAGHEMVAPAAHTDYTADSVREQAELVLNANGQVGRRYRRVADYQTWRALTPPPQDRPLAICDTRTIRPQDRVEQSNAIGPMTDPTKVFAITLARYNPDHRWFYFPNMQLDDLLIFRGADTDPDDNPNVFHSSFADPTAGAAAVSRISVESRFFCFYD